MTKQRAEVKREGKRKRVPFGSHRLKLQLSADDLKMIDEAGYVARWFNDQHGRIEAALAGGYEHIDPEYATSLGQSALHEGNTDLNKRVSKVVTKQGEPVRAYLMWIKKRFFNEDQKAKEAVNRQVDDAIRAGQPGGATVENQYIPKTGISYAG